MDDLQRLEAIRISMTNWTPGPEAVAMIEDLRRDAKELAATIISTSPDRRERALALTALEEAVMWGVKAIVLADRDATLEREELS